MTPPRPRLCLEPLETRETPATLVSPSQVTYQDADGDSVRVTFSRPILSQANVNTVFTFDTGSVNGDNTLQQQLRSINLAGLGSAAAGTAVTVTATRSPATGGDGFAAVGQIDGTNLDLGTVTVDGDLGRILAGDATTATTGLAGLTVHSVGRYGTDTGAFNLVTGIRGRLAFLRVATDVKEASLLVQGGADGRLGSVFVGGSLIGGAGDGTGQIGAAGAMGPVTIRGDVIGGDGFGSGSVGSGGFDADGRLAGVTIGRSVWGGAGDFSGRISTTGDAGPVAIRGTWSGGRDPTPRRCLRGGWPG